MKVCVALMGLFLLSLWCSLFPGFSIIPNALADDPGVVVGTYCRICGRVVQSCPHMGGGGGGGDDHGSSGSSSQEIERQNLRINAYNAALKYYAAGLNQPPEKALSKWQDALRLLEKALSYQPGDPKTLRMIRQVKGGMKCCEGQAALARGAYSQAIALFNEAGEIFPEGQDVWNQNLEQARSLMHDPGSAHKDYPNVVWTGEGQRIRPAPGYRWASEDPAGKQDFRVVQKEEVRQAQAMADLRTQVNSLIADAGSASGSSGLGGTRSLYRMVHGTKQEFTTLENFQNGPGGAGAQLVSTVASGVTAASAMKPTDAAGRSGLGFDTFGASQGTLPVLGLTGRTGEAGAFTVEDRYLQDPEIRIWMDQKQQADQDYQTLGNELKTVNDQLKVPGSDRGALQVDVARILTEMKASKSNSDTIRVKVEDKIRLKKYKGLNLTEQQEPSGNRATVPSP